MCNFRISEGYFCVDFFVYWGNIMVMNSRGFTLIELLVVIAIVGLLSSIVVASVSSAKDKAKVAAGLRFDSSVQNAIGDHLVANWTFDSVSGSTVFDSAGNNDATIIGSVPMVDGVIGKAASFNGSANYINAGNPIDLQITGNQTISFWMYPTDFSSRRNPVAKAYGGEGTFTLETSGNLNYYYGTSGANTTPYYTYLAHTGIELNKWTHILIRRDLTNMKLMTYVNGVKTKEVNLPGIYSSATPSSLNFLIGAGYVSPFKGYIDEVRVYDEVFE